MSIEIEPILKPVGAPVYFVTPFGEKVSGKFFGFRRMSIAGEDDVLGVAVVKNDFMELYSLSACRRIDNGKPSDEFYPFHISFKNPDGSDQYFRFVGHVPNLENPEQGCFVAMQTIDVDTGNGITALFTINQILDRQQELYGDLSMRRAELGIW